MMKHILINILFGIFSTIGFSQQVIGGTGGDAKNSNGSFSYSVGQLIVTQVNPTSGNKILSQTCTVLIIYLE